MAFALTNFTNPYTVGAWNPVTATKQADQTIGTGTAIDLGSAVYKAARVTVYIKTLTALVATDYVTCTLQVGTGASVTSPINIAQEVKQMITGDTNIQFTLVGICPLSFFRSAQVVVSTTSSHAITYDILFEAL